MKVFFLGNFWGSHHKERAGKRVELNHSFEWDGYTWLLPAAYVCSRGLVLDFCKQIPRQRIQSIMDRWGEKAKNNLFSPEEQELLEFDNPMSELLHCKAMINGRHAEGSRKCAVCWNPLMNGLEQKGEDAGELADEYHCDKEQGWQFIRVAIPWPYKRRPKRIRLTLSLEPYTMPYPCGQHFTFHMEDRGRQLQLCHPINKKECTLYVSGMQAGVVPGDAFHKLGAYEYPRHFAKLGYHYNREISQPEFVIHDCAKSDKPHPIPGHDSVASIIGGAASVGIIGGSYGIISTTFIPDQAKENQIIEQYAISSLHFEPVAEVEWRISALVKRGEVLTLELPIIAPY